VLMAIEALRAAAVPKAPVVSAEAAD
jgi:hypothetical protein